ncbi:hypothetical protein [Scytonema sp. PCC 10023]|uniref:hypothetical protein n=1 Tax=Scytonema sp. PCC 10023 TaxID=1680591 RepID=UPI0039C60787
MGKNDLLVFTNEIGSNSKWDGRVRGGCKYHAEQVYGWIKNKIGIRSQDFFDYHSFTKYFYI